MSDTKYKVDITIHDLPSDDKEYNDMVEFIEEILIEYGCKVTIGLGEPDD